IVRDANGCDDTMTVTVNEPNPLTFDTSTTAASCNGVCDGQIDFTSTSGGTSPYDYSIDGGSNYYTDSTSFPNQCAGTYTLIVRDANGCDDTMTVTVNEPNQLNFNTSTDSATCFNTCDGQIDFTSTSGGTSPYDYSIDGGSNYYTDSTSFPGQCAGTYTVIVRDANNCDDTSTVTIEEPTDVSFTTNIDSVTCKDSCDGQITISASGGITPYQYSNNNGTSFQSSDIFDSLCAGSYDLIVRDDNGCDDSATVNVEEPNALSLSTSKNDATCKDVCDGDATVTVSGGTSPYRYQWDDGDFQTTATADSLCDGTYQVIVTDTNGCEDTTTETISEPSAINLSTSTDSATCGNSDGRACVTPSGGAGGYTYQWDSNAGSQTDSCADNLSSGSYKVVVTDANSCKDSTTANVSDAGSPSATMADSSMVTCYGACDGTAEVSVSGGTPPYTYNWSSGTQNDSVVSDLCEGTHTVDVTDDIGCTTSEDVVITQPDSLNTNMSQNNVTCNSACNGDATVSVSGGTTPYSYSWDNSTDTTATADSLCAGKHIVTVTDSNGCTKQDSVTITEPPALSLSDSIVNVTCNGNCDGEIHLTASGGVSPYEFSIDTGSTYQGSNSFSNLCAGDYDIIVRDDNGCMDTITSTVTEPNVLSHSTSVDSSSCSGVCDGRIDFTSTSGGTTPYDYSIDGGTNYYTDSTSFPGQCAGTYTLIVRDSNSCDDTSTVTVEEPDPLTFNTGTDSASCAGVCDGQIDFTSTSGGTTPYDYSIDGGSNYYTD
ncbi:MAG: SprB repeat-containing protein, partial [Flavobacteriales bacterium]